MRLKGKIAIITGAASGTGLAMAHLFTQEGAVVIAGDWNGERLDAAVNDITAQGGTIIGVQGNIADQAAAEHLIDLAVEKFGRLDILCNNAGIMDYMQPVGSVDNDIWQRVLEINLNGPMYTSRRAVPQMVAQGGGSIINVASFAGTHGGVAGAAYTVSKHALIGLTRNTAWMYAKQGIRCNAIGMGATKTNIQETMPMDKLHIEGATRAGEFGRLVPAQLDPIDIATLALFLGSDEARYINGAVIAADGGWDAA